MFMSFYSDSNARLVPPSARRGREVGHEAVVGGSFRLTFLNSPQRHRQRATPEQNCKRPSPDVIAMTAESQVDLAFRNVGTNFLNRAYLSVNDGRHVA